MTTMATLNDFSEQAKRVDLRTRRLHRRPVRPGAIGEADRGRGDLRPVLAVMAFDSPEEAIELADSTRFGLAAAIWTEDISTALRTARRMQAGTVWVNNYDGTGITSPVGGYKESGLGCDKSIHAIDKYTQTNTTWIEF